MKAGLLNALLRACLLLECLCLHEDISRFVHKPQLVCGSSMSLCILGRFRDRESLYPGTDETEMSGGGLFGHWDVEELYCVWWAWFMDGVHM